MEQQERFAVGMIGFALQRDEQFRAHFLERVGVSKDPSTANGWEILVEPGNWGDLVLKHQELRWLVVVEFKIGTELKAHQNPAHRLFELEARNGQCAGYGREIAQIAQREKWLRLQYVTIERRSSWSEAVNVKRKLVSVPLEWRCFLRTDISEESQLERDVYDCLSRFGVSIFAARSMNQMKLADQATQPLTLLSGVLGKFNAEFKRALLDAGPDYLGIKITKTDFRKIAQIVDSKGDQAGWFGYESGPPIGPRLSVWFYCDSAGKKDGPQDKIKIALRKAGFRDQDFTDDDPNCGVMRKAEDSEGDLEWFERVLRAFDK